MSHTWNGGRLVLLRATDVLQRRFEEFSVQRTGRPLSEFVLMLKLGRRTLPW